MEKQEKCLEENGALRCQICKWMVEGVSSWTETAGKRLKACMCEERRKEKSTSGVMP